MVGHRNGRCRPDQPVAVERADNEGVGASLVDCQIVVLSDAVAIVKIGIFAKDRDSQIGKRIERGDQRRAREDLYPWRVGQTY
jgi:hypothetical protein